MSIKPNKFGNNYEIIEGDLDPLKLAFLEDKLELRPGMLSEYNLIDWRYMENTKQIILLFKGHFNWPISIYEFDPRSLDRNKISHYDGLTFVPFNNISIE